MSICYQNINSTKILVVIIILGGFNVLHLLLFFEEKNECFMKFQEFKALVESLSIKKIKIMNNDNDGEFLSNLFASFLKSHEIQD
jgi:hypothetical protein